MLEEKPNEGNTEPIQGSDPGSDVDGSHQKTDDKPNNKARRSDDKLSPHEMWGYRDSLDPNSLQFWAKPPNPRRKLALAAAIIFFPIGIWALRASNKTQRLIDERKFKEAKERESCTLSTAWVSIMFGFGFYGLVFYAFFS